MGGSCSWIARGGVSLATIATTALLLQPPGAAVPPAPSPLELFESMGAGRALPARLDAALTILGDPAAYHPLLVRTAVALAGEVRDERAEPGLAFIVGNGIAEGGVFDAHTRMAAANALGRIGGAERFPSVAAATAPPLAGGAPPGPGAGRGGTPGGGGGATRCPGSRSALPCPPPGAAPRAFRGFSEETADALLACAAPGDTRRVRAACIQALGRGRVVEAVPTLSSISDDPSEDFFVVLAAERALSQILENNHVTDATVNAAILQGLRELGAMP